jgi:hypothetical protein
MHKNPYRNRRALTTPIIVFIAVLVVLGAIAATILLSGNLQSSTIIGSQNLTTKTMDFTDFTNIAVGGGFKVEILRSSTYSVSITADNNTFDYIEVSKTDKTLNIGLRAGYSYQNVTLKTQIKMPDLLGVTLSGGTRGTASEFTSIHDFTVELSGGSSLEIEGSARDLQIEASGGSRADLTDFPAHNATVHLSGGSQTTVNLNGILDATLSGGSQLQYTGTPTMGDISLSGGSSISKKP